MNLELFGAFFAITTVLVLTPGPIVTLVISTGATQGVRAALATVAGTTLGNAILLLASRSGSTGCWRTPLPCSPRCAGPARSISSTSESTLGGMRARVRPRSRRIAGANLIKGVLVALTNPKTIVFFTAFLPQFVDPKLPSGPQLAIMCAVTVVFAGLSDCAYALASGYGRAWFQKPGRTLWLGRASGTVLIAGGVWLSLARRTN